MGRPLAPFTITTDQLAEIRRWVRRPKTSQGLALGARIILAAAKGWSNSDSAEDLGVCRPTAGKWRQRFLDSGLDGLVDTPRPGKPRQIGDEDVERILAITIERTPRNATHWSTRSMAEATGLGQSSISRIWRAFSLQPHRIKRS